MGRECSTYGKYEGKILLQELGIDVRERLEWILGK